MEAILVHGSFATGRAGPESDLDLDLNSTVWEQESKQAENWSFGLPVELAHIWLWRGDGHLVALLGEAPVLTRPGSAPEIEDMVDAVLKMRRAARADDELGTRLQAQAAARYGNAANGDRRVVQRRQHVAGYDVFRSHAAAQRAVMHSTSCRHLPLGEHGSQIRSVPRASGPRCRACRDHRNRRAAP